VTIAVVLMVLLVGEAHVVEGLPAKDVKEPTSKVEKLKEEPQPKEEAAPVQKAAEQGEGGEASDGEEEKKGGEETVNRKDGGSSFVATGSSTSSSPPADIQEIPPPGKQKPTESNKKTENESSESGKGADVKSEIVKLEESSRGEGKEVASQQEKTAKGPNSEPLPNESPAVDSEIPEKEDHVMDANEEDAPAVKEESKVDTPMETSFEKQMDSGAADPPQSNFFSYFIVLAIITIIAYLVFHNKKKILGLIVEGRSGRQAGRRRSGGREYRKLDSNMEDMMETGRETSMRQVIY